MDRTDLMSIQSLSIHLWELCGYQLGDPVLQTGISPQRSRLKKLKDIFFGVDYIPAFSLNDNDLERICSKLSKKDNYVVVGYPSSLNIIAEYAINKEIKLNAKTVIGLGDKLFAHYRKIYNLLLSVKFMKHMVHQKGFK